MANYSVTFCYIGVASWGCAWMSTTMSMISSSRQAKMIKTEYFKSILRQDVGYYDTVDAAVISQQLTDETKIIQDAIGEKLSTSIKDRLSK